MAKFLRLCCVATLALLLAASYPANAQVIQAPLQQYTSVALGQQFTQYQVFKLDAKEMDTQFKSNSEAPLQLVIGPHNWRLHLTPSRIFSSNYMLRVETPQGIVTTYPKHNIAFKGYEYNSGGAVRITLTGEHFAGFVESGGERYYIEPLWYFEPFAPRDLFVLYPKSAVVPYSGNPCGVTEQEQELFQLEQSVIKNDYSTYAESACYEVELAIASDHLMFNKYGSVANVESHNVNVINNVQNDYTGVFNHDLEFVIVTQFVSTSAPGPWTNSTDAGTLLSSFRTWGNAGNFGVGFDVGELWTNRDFNGGTIGIAYLNGVCNSNKYHCLQDFSNNSELLRCLTSHEIGHNFSATHDAGCPPPNLIMCPAVSTANEWSNQSVNQISGYITNRINAGCFETCGPPPPPLVAAFDWSPNPGCVNQPVSFSNQSTGIITTYSWVFPGGSPPTSTQQNPTVTWGTAGTKNVTLTITGVGGSNSVTLPVEINPLPVANFTYTVSGLVVTFTNTSQHGDSYLWEFGDGFESTEVSPVHEYTEPGFYVVKLTVTNPCGSSSKTSVVNTAPIANFSASPTSGCAALVVQMMNESSSNASTFSWSFPGGAPVASNLANPTVVYSIAGTYTITLTATNASGSHTFTRTNYITVTAAPVANFTSVTNGNTVTFTNTSLQSPTSYLWEFGDGNTSTAVNPTHTYAAPGTYNVVLTATNACGTSTKTGTVTIESSGAPVAAFVANPSSGCAPLTVNFTNNSVSAVSYQWQFPGGNPDNSTEVSPTVIYENPGDYTATLIATNANGSDTASVVVSVLTVPTAEFIYLVQNDTTYYFTNNSTGATAYHWDFGDGNTSTDENPVHHYPALDSVVTYTVVLTAENDCGTATYTQNVAVVTRPVAGFTAAPNTGCAPLTVQFTNTSTPNASTFHWLFPGGTPDTSVVSNPTVVYQTPGTYSVTLIVSNSAGRDTSVRTDYIVVNTVPTASFTSAANGLLVAFTNTSTGATEYSWDFGDNSGSIEASPTHEYAADGDYIVVLTATNNCGTVTSTQSVSVATAPTAGFTASANAGCAPLTVQFTNTSSSNATAFDWDFPGGVPSGSNAQTPPAVLYEVPGTYTVTLTVSNAAGTSSFTQVVVVSGGPTANFSSTVSGLDVQFTSSSSNAIAYSWDFGDNEGSNAPNPNHTYAADGTYTVVLTVSNDCGTSTFTQNVVITTAPDAGFSASTTSGCAVLSVTFTDISDGAPVSWEWSFPGGVPSTSNVQSPTVQYFIPGVYDVTLVVTSAGGSTSSFTQPNYITVFGPPTANFSSSASGNTVSFTNGSSDATSYIWNFGDQSTSTSENPTHTYAEDGVYTVTLTATNNCGSSIYEQTVTVATPPTASFTQDGNSGCAPLTVQFASTSSANATSLAWDFPGGTPAFSFEANPVVTWNNAGTYVVTLTASNSAGTSTSTVTINVNDVPNVGFTHSVSGPNATFANTSSNATSYVWNFGDGSDVSNETNPTHTYAQAGTYTVTLTAENECGTATFTQTVEIVGSAPTPAISANSAEGCAPFTVKFSDQSSGSPDSWNWSFPGGSPASSTEQNPQVTYNLPGVYDVTLEVGNAFGGGSTTFPGYVTVLGPPTANFVASPNQTTVAFANTSQGATSYEWNFGDGSPISTEAAPTHTYAAPGTYTVTLVATNSCGSSIIEVTLTLTSGIGEVAWVDAFRLFPNPNTGAFTVEMSGLPQKEVDFVLFNALGQFVKRETLDFGAGVLRHQFDYGDLAAGFYTLRVQGSNGQAIHLKVTVGR